MLNDLNSLIGSGRSGEKTEYAKQTKAVKTELALLAAGSKQEIKHKSTAREQKAEWQRLVKVKAKIIEEMERDSVTGGGGKTNLDDLKPVSNDEGIALTKGVQSKTKAAAERTLAMVNDTREVGQGIIDEMEEQGDKLKHISDKATTITQDIKRADRLLKNFRRRLKADKIIWVLVCLVLIGIIVVIVVVNLPCADPCNRDDSAIPDIMKLNPKISNEINNAMGGMDDAAGGRRLRDETPR